MPANIVTLSQYVANPDAQLSADSLLEVRGFFTRNFISGDGVTPIYGNATNGEQGPYSSITATLNVDGKVAVAAHDIEVTTLSNPTARYFEILFVDGASTQILIPNTQGATGWEIPSVYGSPVNFGELALYNRAKRLVYPPDTYFTADETILEIDLRAGQFDYAAVGRLGVTQLSYPPLVASIPIALSENDPRVVPLRDTGLDTLVAGASTTISTTLVELDSPIQAIAADNNITGRLWSGNRVAGVSFDITSENGADSGLFRWFLYQ